MGRKEGKREGRKEGERKGRREGKERNSGPKNKSIKVSTILLTFLKIT